MNKDTSSFLKHATTQGYRTNVVKPLMAVVIILFIASILLFALGVEMPGYIVGGLAIFVVLFFLGCYLYCLLKNPDLLRSEKYNLEKTALESFNLKGDSIAGIKAPEMDYLIITSEDLKIEKPISSEGSDK